MVHTSILSSNQNNFIRNAILSINSPIFLFSCTWNFTYDSIFKYHWDGLFSRRSPGRNLYISLWSSKCAYLHHPLSIVLRITLTHAQRTTFDVAFLQYGTSVYVPGILLWGWTAEMSNLQDARAALMTVTTTATATTKPLPTTATTTRTLQWDYLLLITHLPLFGRLLYANVISGIMTTHSLTSLVPHVPVTMVHLSTNHSR